MFKKVDVFEEVFHPDDVDHSGEPEERILLGPQCVVPVRGETGSGQLTEDAHVVSVHISGEERVVKVQVSEDMVVIYRGDQVICFGERGSLSVYSPVSARPVFFPDCDL